ncbi:MAG: 50S ribosomal protein L22 [Parcubacteria group bacterium]|nr:50S ribosomal protein L22 [Parcubacteria group bacterium]
MEVKAQARFQRISPRKVRLVVGLLRNQTVQGARNQLSVLPKRASRTVQKVLESAVANAKHNFKMDADALVITRAYVDGGPALKRWMPRAFGRASQIMKRTSHITIVIGEKKAKKKAAAKSSAPRSRADAKANAKSGAKGSKE